MSVVGSYLDIAKKYPDGGYGWMIVLGGFMCNFFVDGMCYSFGLLLGDFKNEFGGTTFQTALAGSLCTGFYLIMGPVSSALENIYGARGVTVVGTLLASAGFLLSTISPNVTYFILSWGIIGGCGFGLVYLPSIVVASHWFQARRGTAMGLIVSGSGMGAAVMSKVVVYLFSKYDWRGVVWILVGLILNMVAMGAFFRPLRSSDLKRKTAAAAASVLDEDFPQIKNTYMSSATGNGSTCHMSSEMNNGVSKQLSLANMYSSQAKVNLGHQPSMYEVCMLWQTHDEYFNANGSKPGAGQVVNHRYVRTGCAMPRREEPIRRSHLAIDTFRTSNLNLNQRVLSERSLTHGRSRHTIYSGGGDYLSIADFSQYETVPNGNEGGGQVNITGLKEAVIEPLKEMLDFSLLKRRSFSLLVFATVCTMMALFIPFVYITSYAEMEARVSRSESSTLMVLLGLSNTLGRLIAGFLSDYSWMDPLLMNNMALIMAGMATIAVPLLKSFYMLAAYVILFGLGIATFVCLRTIILDNIFGIEYLNNSFGIMLLFHGVATVIGTPVAGMLFDYTGSYTYTFVTAGALLAFSGAICLPLRQLAAWEERRLERERTEGIIVQEEEPAYNGMSSSPQLYPVDEVETVL